MEREKPLRIIFMGTPEFAVPSLERLAQAGYKPIAVATVPDRPQGRGQKVMPSPVKSAAQRLGIEQILQPESVKDPAFAEAVAALQPEVIVVVAFQILPPAVYIQASRGAFNLHGSLLPCYRGAAPINRAVMAGEQETGVTTFFLKEKVDTGAIILKKTMSIGPDETAGEVHDRMMHLGAEAVLETVQRIEAGTAQGLPQDDSQATPAPKIFRDDARIPWGAPASQVHNHIRGLSPYPGAWTLHGTTQLKIFATRLSPMTAPAEPGTVLASDQHLVVACGQGALEVATIQQEGHRRLDAEAFLRGYDLPVGAKLT